MKSRKITTLHIIFFAVIEIVLIYLVLKLYPYIVSDGLFLFLTNYTEYTDIPISITTGSIKACFFVSIFYVGGIFLWATDERNFRHGEEHGSAKFGNVKDVNSHLANMKEPTANKILTQNIRLNLDSRKTRRNLFVIVVGGSGAGKTRFYVKPNLMQLNTSYIVLDPKGELTRDMGNMFKEAEYNVKVIDLKDMHKSARYNPFKYIQNDNEIQKLVTNIFANTGDKNSKSSDPYWDNAAAQLLSAIFYFLWHELPPEDQNFSMVMELLDIEKLDENSNGPSPLSALFHEHLKNYDNHIAMKFFTMYEQAPQKTRQSILSTLTAKLQKFTLDDLAKLTMTDDLELEKIGEEKTVLFVIIPDNDTSFNFVVGMLYTQLFQMLMYQADVVHQQDGGRLPVHVHFVMDEFANVALPDDFDKLLATMRSREISVSIILQNLAQLKALFEKQWESIKGNCDSFLYLGGNEENTHETLSKILGSETIDTNTFGESKGRNGSSSKNWQMSARKLLESDEVRLMDERVHDAALLVVSKERPVLDSKYDLMKHPNIKMTVDGGAPIYQHGMTEKDYSRGKVESVTTYKNSDITEEIIINTNAKDIITS